MNFTFLERNSLLQRLLSERKDLTEEDKRSALSNFLRGEPIGLPPLEGWADQHRKERQAELVQPTYPDLESPNISDVRSIFTQADTGLDYGAAREAAKALLPPIADVGAATTTIFPALTVALDRLAGEPAVAEGERLSAEAREAVARKALDNLSPFSALFQPSPITAQSLPTESDAKAIAEAGSAVVAGLQETGHRLISAGAGLWSAPQGLEAVEAARAKVAANRAEATKLAHALGLLGPEDVTEEKAAEVLYPEPGVGQEVTAEVFKLVDPDTAGALASLVAKGGFLALTKAVAGSRQIKRAAFNEATKEASEFAQQVARTASESVDPERVAAWVDAIEDTSFAKKGGNVDALAAYIQKYGIDATVERQIFKLSPEEGKTLKAVLGDNQPAEFGTRVQRVERAREREREQLVELISSNDPESEMLLVSNRQKAASIIGQELTQAQVDAAAKRGLTVRAVSLADVPKPNQVRIVYDPELVGAIQEGLRLSDNPGLRSLAEYGDTPDEFVRRLAQKNPRQLSILSAGGLQSDFAGQATVRLTIGGRAVAERVVNAADMVPTARWFVDQAKVARGFGAKVMAGDLSELRKTLPEAALGEQEAFLARATKGKIGVQFVGQPIEQLAAMSGIGLDNLRMIQSKLSDIGLTHLEATTLAGTLSGTADQLARQSILIEAAKTMKAAKPKKFPDVQSAAQALRKTLEEIDVKLPPRAKFFRFDRPQAPEPAIIQQRMLSGEVYYDPVENGYRPRQPDIDPPGYAVFDPEQAGKPVVVNGIDLSDVSPAEAENLTRYGHKHPPVPTETPTGTIIRKLTGQSEEAVTAQVQALEDTLVQRMQTEVGTSFSPEAVREFLFGPDPQMVLNRELRRVGIDQVMPSGVAPGSHEAAIKAVQEQAFGLRQALRQEYEASNLVKAKLAAEELQALENGQLQSAVELRQVQARRMQLSEELQRLDKERWDAAGRRDNAAFDAAQARVDAIGPEMVALRQKANELDAAITEAEKKALERAERLPSELNVSESVALSARSSSQPELTRYASGEEAYVAAARKNEGKAEGVARAEWRAAHEPGWGSNIPPDAPTGPHNPTMSEAAWHGEPLDSSELLRMDRELSGPTRYKIIARSMRSPLTSIPRSLGLRQKLATWTTVKIEERLRFMEHSMRQSALRRRVLPDKTDQFLAGRLLENDAAAIPKPWLDEVLAGQTPKSQAVREYMSMVREATNRVANHADVPVTQRLRDYFARFRLHDSKAIKQMLTSRIAEAKKAGQVDVVKALEGELDTWTKGEVGFLNAYDREWIPDSMLNYGPLEKRLDKVWDYVQDPEQMLGIAESTAARYRFLKDTLPEWNKAIQKAGGRITEQGVVKTSAEFSDVIDRLMEGRRALWEPPDKMSTAFRRKIAELMTKPLVRGVAQKISPQLLNEVSHFTRRLGFLMHIGGRTATALTNLSSLPLHVLTRMHPGDVSKGMAHFLYDQAVSGEVVRGLPGMEGLMSQLGPVYGRGMSHVRPLYDEAVTGMKVHWWELGEGHTDAGLLRKMTGGATEAALDTAALMFRSTESVNRGATFYSEALRAFDALEEFRKTGKLSSRYYDGWIAPSEKDLLSDWKTLKARVSSSMRATEPGAAVLTPQELGRIKTIDMAAGTDLEKARAYFDPERGIREALASDDPSRWVKDRAVAAMQETQGTYNRMNRPRFIQDYAPWAEAATQFLDFSRQQIEMFAQRLSTPQKLAFLALTYAIGGPRALPLMDFMVNTLGFIGVGDKRIDEHIAEFESEGGILAGIGPAMGQDFASRMKMNLPFSSLKGGKAGQTVGERVMSLFGGPGIAPFVEAHSGIADAAETAKYVAKKTGQPVTQAAASQTGGARQELRQTVKTSEVGSTGTAGQVLANPAVQAILNLPGQALMRGARVFEELGAQGMAAYAAAAGEALQFQPSDRPGYLELPGDRILATSGMLRDLVRGAKLAETGATSRRGRVGTPVESDFAREMSQLLGTTPADDVLERQLVHRMSKEAEVGKKARTRSIETLIEAGTPKSRAEGRRATATEIADHMQANGWLDVKPADVKKYIFARSNPLIGRFAAELSKEGVQDLYKLEGLRERLIEGIESARTTGNEASAAALMSTFLETRRSFYENQLKATGRPTRALQASLAKDLAEIPDPQQNQRYLDAFMTGFKDRLGNYKLDTDMMMLHKVAATGDEQMLERLSRLSPKGGLRDEVERQQLLVIGLYLMELRKGMFGELTASVQ